MPPELIYTQEERNSKLKIQNFRVYQELRRKMEMSIQKQRKALKHSIQQFVAADENGLVFPSGGVQRTTFLRNLTDRNRQRKKVSKTVVRSQMPIKSQEDSVEQIAMGVGQGEAPMTEYSLQQEAPQWAN